MENYLELAKGLQNSNVQEVAGLAKAYLELYAKLVKITGELVMVKHEKIFKKLVESGD